MGIPGIWEACYGSLCLNGIYTVGIDARAGARSFWAFDGPDRPTIKRGTNVKTEEPVLYSEARKLISAFGDKWRMAPGEGEAEIVAMSQNGEVDAIVTTDSDVFPLGAKCVLVIDSKSCTEANLMVAVYRMDDIKRKLRLTQGDFVLYSALVGNGDACDSYLEALCNDICDEFKTNVHRKMTTAHPALARKLADPAVHRRLLSPDSKALTAFINPLTSYSNSSKTYNRQLADRPIQPQVHDLKAIIHHCTTVIKWKGGYYRFDPHTGSVFAPTHQQSITFRDGHPFTPTSDSITVGKTQQRVDPISTHSVRIDFALKHILGQAIILLNLPVAVADDVPQTIRVTVPMFLLGATSVDKPNVQPHTPAYTEDNSDIEWGEVSIRSVIDLTVDN
ncbi:hypothetical protein MPER_12961 [Moniliophthora perniciosa FA553]|nr:hypothetical protein MPER_12961 [Moniliophthora perniciosa FA553]